MSLISIAFVQSKNEVEFISSRYKKSIIFVPLNLFSQSFLELNKMKYINPIDYIDNRFHKVSIDFTMPIDSIAISGHKFLGCPMPCGVMITRKSLMRNLMQPIEYLNSVDSTITGSRNGLSSLFIWNVINTKGIEHYNQMI